MSWLHNYPTLHAFQQQPGDELLGVSQELPATDDDDVEALPLGKIDVFGQSVSVFRVVRVAREESSSCR